MNKRQKRLTEIFILIFIALFFVAFWNNISWVFNYRTVSEIVKESVNSNFSAENSLNDFADSKIENSNNRIAGNFLQIPKLGVAVPIVMPESQDIQVLSDKLNEGAVYYPGSALPGETGQIAILGHSAPPNWPKIKYDWIFSKIGNLNSGDKLIVNFNDKQYTYSVIEKEVVQIGEDISKSELAERNNVLTLVSCWPPGKNYKRIVIHSKLL